MEFSVAVYGHNKANADGLDVKRARPGDIIAYKPIEQHKAWTPLERQLFLIIKLSDVTRTQMEALCEPEWDLDSYRSYNCLQYIAWSDLYYPAMSRDEKEAKYLRYTEHCQRVAETPQKYWRKRRFSVALEILTIKGVDIELMHNKNIRYSPDVSVNHLELHDKVRNRTVLTEDALQLQKARTLTEILENKTAATIKDVK